MQVTLSTLLTFVLNKILGGMLEAFARREMDDRNFTSRSLHGSNSDACHIHLLLIIACVGLQAYSLVNFVLGLLITQFRISIASYSYVLISGQLDLMNTSYQVLYFRLLHCPLFKGEINHKKTLEGA